MGGLRLCGHRRDLREPGSAANIQDRLAGYQRRARSRRYLGCSKFCESLLNAGQILPFSKQSRHSLKTSIERPPDKHNYFCAPPPLSPLKWTVLGNHRDIPSTTVKLPFKRHEVRSENIVATIHRWNSQCTGYKQHFEGICTEKSYLALLNTNQTIDYLWDYVLKIKIT